MGNGNTGVWACLVADGVVAVSERVSLCSAGLHWRTALTAIAMKEKKKESKLAVSVSSSQTVLRLVFWTEGKKQKKKRSSFK